MGEASYDYTVKMFEDTLRMQGTDIEKCFFRLATSAAIDIINQKSEWGAWVGRIVNSERPQDYITVDITGVERLHSVIFSVGIVKENEVVDMKEYSIYTVPEQYEESIRTGILLVQEEYNKYFKEKMYSVGLEYGENVPGQYSLYGFGDRKDKHMDEHYKLLTNAGYAEDPTINLAKIQGKDNAYSLPFPDAKVFTYYAIERPLSFGAYPIGNDIFVENFPSKKIIPEIGQEAYGKITYGQSLTAEEMKTFGLVPSSGNSVELQSAEIHATKNKAPYMGFAYARNSERPIPVYGNSEEDILEVLRKWNQSRREGAAYITCNIGVYNPDSNKYKDFQKFNVKTGDRLSNIYLQLPKGLEKEEFERIVKYLKDNGAHFHHYLKRWYITPDQAPDKFMDYLPDAEREQSTAASSENLEEIGDMQEGSVIGYFSGVDRQYVVDLKNGETINVSEREVLQRLGKEKMEDVSPEKVVEVLEDKVREHMQLMSGEEYDISVGKEFYDNRCTVYLKNGQMIDLLGDQFGVHFPSLPAEDISRIVADYMKMEKARRGDVLHQIGEEVSIYLPEYQISENGIKEVSGISQIKGELLEKSDLIYSIKTAEGICQINIEDAYNERQAKIMERAVNSKMAPEQLDIIGQQNMEAAQMEQLYYSFKDGLSVNQVALFARLECEVWQMDMYRYGMGNGLPYDSIREVVTGVSYSANQWEESRRLLDKMIKSQRNLIIKDLKDNQLIPEKRLIGKIEKLNGITGKLHTVKDILQTLKEQGANTSSEAGKLFKEIGKDINYQKNRLLKSPDPKIPIR